MVLVFSAFGGVSFAEGGVGQTDGAPSATKDFFGEKLSELFGARAGSTVIVKYMDEREENRYQYVSSAIVYDKTGLLIMPSSEISAYARPSNLKDFKILFLGSPDGGVDAEFLGSDYITGAYFLKMKTPLPKFLKPVSEFPRGEVCVGDDVWGVGIFGEDRDYEPYLIKGSVAVKSRRPFTEFAANDAVSMIGGAVFDSKGSLVGWALSRFERVLALRLDNRDVNMLFSDQLKSSRFLAPDVLDGIAKRVPSNPAGDPKPWLGVVNMQIMKRDVAGLMGIDTDRCALVVGQVVRKSPAERAGVKAGDIVISMDSRPLERLRGDAASLSLFSANLLCKKIGDTVRLGIRRGGETLEIPVVLAQSPKSYGQSSYRYFPRLGFSVREFLLDDAVARRTLDPTADAPVVQFVKSNSPASSAQPSALGAGDIVRAVNSVPVSGYSDAVERLSKLDADSSVREIVLLAETFNETKVIRIKLD